MKTILKILLLITFLLPAGQLKCEEPAHSNIPKEILDKQFICQIAGYLYRWYMDETDIESISENENFVVKIHVMNTKLDKGDNSRYAELFIPNLRISVRLKKSDYRIDELNLNVKSNGFKVNHIARYNGNSEIPANSATVKISMKEMKMYLFETRNKADFPNPELYERIKKAFHTEFKDELLKKIPDDALKKDWITYVSPLSPVANEFWAFMENAKMIVLCSSDIDLTNTAVWEHESLTFKIYDIYNQMVVSLGETEGDNSFMTRDQIGRILYNCVVLGDRIVMKPPEKQK